MKSSIITGLCLRPSIIVTVASLALLCSTLLSVRSPLVFAAEESSATAEAPTAEAKTEQEKEKSGDEKRSSRSTEEAEKKSDAARSRPKRPRRRKRKVTPQRTEKKAESTAESNGKAPAETKRDKVRLALLVLKDSLPESAGQMGPFGEIGLDLREAINRLEKAAKDKSIAGVVLDIQNPAIGRGKIEELRGAIARFREAGKKVYAMLESAMPADYLVACACDEIVMPEGGMMLLPGIHAEATFYKGLLGKVGVEADFIHIGAYKGAAEPLTREKFSEPVRENMTVADRQHVRRNGHDDRQGPAALDRPSQGSHRHAA